jgi:beta-lactamase regulating signal transducer with metallopeptidase domain
MTDTSLSQTLIFGHIWQSVAIAAVLAGALIIGKRMRGATRYGLGVAAFVASLALPLAAFIPGETIVAGLLKQLDAPVSIEAAAPVRETVVGPTFSFEAPVAPVTPAAPVTANGAELMAVNMQSVPMAPLPPAPAAVTVTYEGPAEPTSLFTLPAIQMPDIGLPLLLVWLGVAGLLLARTARDLIAVERLVARARPADLPSALQARMKGIRVVVSPEAPGPMAAGLLRPAIVLPESIALGSPGMAGLLEHEHAHIRRYDMLAALGQRIILALLWWSPALYWISRRIDEEREVACDEAAVDRTGDAKAFARSLTKQAENQLWVRAPRLAVGAIGPRSHFSRRVRRLIDIAKTGGSPAKYSGRLAFAGLAVAVGVAAMVTPRFTADAQQSEQGVIDLTKPGTVTTTETETTRTVVQLDGAPPHGDYSYAFNSDEFASLGAELEAMMAELGPELEGLMAGFGPELEGELAGLSTELAAMGIDIGAMVSQEVLANLPQIMDEVQRSLDEAGVDGDIHGWNDMSEEERAEVRAALDGAREEVRTALEQAREEMKHALGPEMRENIRASLADARAELADHREEIANAMRESHNGLAIAQAALASARAEMEAARASGEFENFNFDRDVMEELRKAGIALDGAALDGGKGKVMVMSGKKPAHLLVDAADDCDTTVLNKLITQDKVDVNSMLPGQGTALMAAADSSCIDAARLLVNAGADVNRGFPGQGTPLSIAAENNALPVVQLLLDRGADVNAVQPGARTPLVEAIREGNLAIVKALVQKGADLNAKHPQNGMRTPLDIAVREGNDAVTDYLRSKGAATSKPAAN